MILRGLRGLTLVVACVCLNSCGDHQASSRLDSITIEATAENFYWTFRYPGADGVLGTDDDKHSKQDLFLPDHAAVTVQLKSKDYLYSMELPELDLKQIAVPDLEFELQFETGKERIFKLLGDQFCGYSHKTLIGKVFVRQQDTDFYDWAKQPI